MQAVNAAVRGATPFWDALADVGNDPNIGAFAGNSANAYFAGDGIHLSDLGQAVVAQYCIAALQSLGVY
jgi:hypothetical protein